MDSEIQDFLKGYFAEYGLSRTHADVRYVEHNFYEDDYEGEIRKLKTGRMRAVFKVAAWLNWQKIEPLGKGGILVVADRHGQAFAAIKVTDIDIVKYGEMTEDLTQAFAIGDGSVKSWQNTCKETLNLECIHLKVDFDENTEILVTWFDVIFPTNK